MTKPTLPAKKKPTDDLTPEEQAERSEMVRLATGTTNDALQNRLLLQAFRTAPERIESEHKKRAGKAIVEGLMGIAPEDGPEGMLAVQMVGAHKAAMECMRRAMDPGISAQARDLNFKHAAKFMSLYPQQMAALDKHRGKGQQKMTVEYVNVEAGGQAIVGNVNTDAKAKPANDQGAPALSDDRAADELSREALKPAKPAKQPVVRKRTR